MKAEELMIGTLVYLEGNYIHAINGNNLKFVETEHIPSEPIEITPEILRAIGFEQEARDFLGYDMSDWFSLETEDYHLSLRSGLSNTKDRGWSANIDNADFQSIGSCDLQYINQLQNFMTLVGCEIKIELEDIENASK